LKPLQRRCQIPHLFVKCKNKNHAPLAKDTNRLNLWLSARRAAGRLPHPVTLG
jgi:hypothetical protein